MKRLLITLSGLATAILLLPCFSLAGSATISWNANTDDDLSGYRIYYSATKGGPYGSSTALIPKTQTSYTISSLSNGTYYFVVTAVDTSSNESAYSSEVSKTITSTTTSTATSTTSTTTPASASTATATSASTSATTATTTSSAASPISTAQATRSSVEAAITPTGTSASPISLPATGIYGKVSGNAEQTQEVNFTFSGRAGKVKVYYKGYDVDSKKEVSILINGKRVGYAKKTKNSKWGKTRSITIKAKYVKNSGANILTFRNSKSTNKWGVQNISIK